MPLKLGVNLDHVATLRQVRGTSYPDPVEAAHLAAAGGASGITAHLREDRRHMLDDDIRRLRTEQILPLNLEMAIHPDVVALALEVGPPEVCLVPERREELTTEGGLDARGQFRALAPVVRSLRENGAEVSLFIEPDEGQVRAAVDLGAPAVELHTGRYCDRTAAAAEAELVRLRRAAQFAYEQGLKVNAGHGIHLGNVEGILTIPRLHALNIGHSIVARAVFVGLTEAVREMAHAMYRYPLPAPPP